MLFVNTRPVERAEQLTQGIKKMGIDVLSLPLLELQPLALSANLIAQFAAMAHAQVVVVVSPTAAHIGLKYLKDSGYTLNDLQHLHWIAVGEKTAEALQEIGLVAHVPDVETSEGMLELPILQELKIKSIVFWRGEGGRQFMMDSLAEKNIHILNMVLYTRGLPQKTVTSFQHVAETLKQYHGEIYVCISSEASWLNWLSLVKHDLEDIMQCHYIVLGTRLHGIVARKIPLKKILYASSLRVHELGSLMQR